MCNTSSPLEKVLSKWSLFVHLLPLPHCSHKNVPWLVAITLASELLPSGFCLFVCFRKCNWSIWQAASQCSLIKHNVESMVWWAYFLIFFKKLSFFSSLSYTSYHLFVSIFLFVFFPLIISIDVFFDVVMITAILAVWKWELSSLQQLDWLPDHLKASEN